jgi:hypothetical protein
MGVDVPISGAVLGLRPLPRTMFAIEHAALRCALVTARDPFLSRRGGVEFTSPTQ